MKKNFLNRGALGIAEKNFNQRRSNALAQSFEDGCHGVLGVSTEQKLRELFLEDYLKFSSGETVEIVNPQKPYVIDRGGR